jgi:hypothetical protein
MGKRDKYETDKLRSGRPFKLSLTSLIPFFHLSLHIYFFCYFPFYFFAGSFRFLFPLRRILVFFYPRSPIGMRKYLYPCPFSVQTKSSQIRFSVFSRRPENLSRVKDKLIHIIPSIKGRSFKNCLYVILRPVENIAVFIYGLLDYVASNSYCVASDNRMIHEL